MKRREFLVEQILDKSFIEDVMKSFAWATLCGTIFAITLSTIQSNDYFQGVFMFAIFIALSTISLLYVVLHVIMPLDSAMFSKDPYWDEKKEQQKGLNKLFEAIKIFITRKGIFYLILCMGYFFYANGIKIYFAGKI